MAEAAQGVMTASRRRCCSCAAQHSGHGRAPCGREAKFAACLPASSCLEHNEPGLRMCASRAGYAGPLGREGEQHAASAHLLAQPEERQEHGVRCGSCRPQVACQLTNLPALGCWELGVRARTASPSGQAKVGRRGTRLCCGRKPTPAMHKNVPIIHLQQCAWQGGCC